jgi:hypothetical protein
MPVRRVTSLLVVCLCCISLAVCATASNAASDPQPFPTVTPILSREARTVLTGFSTALVRHNVRRVRSFLSPRYFTTCNRYLGQKTKYLRCLLDGTPLVVRYRIVRIEYAAVGSKELIALVIYYFLPPGHHSIRSQPFYLNLLPGPHGLWIDSGGLPRG